MTEHSLLAQLLARDPRKLAQFPEIPVDKALAELSEIDSVIAEVLQRTSSLHASSEQDSTGPLLCRLSTHLWRAKNRMMDPASGEVREEFKKVIRHVDGAIDSLSESGVRLQDWSDKAYDVGLPVKVLSYQPAPGLSQDTILETIRPAILWNGRMLQMGEVIVGTPGPSTT